MINKNILFILLLVFVVLLRTGAIDYIIDLAINHPKIFALMLLPSPIPDLGFSLLFAAAIGFVLPDGLVDYIYNKLPYRKKIESLIPKKYEKYIARIVLGYMIITLIALYVIIIYFNEPWTVLLYSQNLT